MDTHFECDKSAVTIGSCSRQRLSDSACTRLYLKLRALFDAQPDSMCTRLYFKLRVLVNAKAFWVILISESDLLGCLGRCSLFPYASIDPDRPRRL